MTGMDWDSADAMSYVNVSIAHGDGYWPSLLSIDPEFGSTISADDARALAATLTHAADACDAENEARFKPADEARA